MYTVRGECASESTTKSTTESTTESTIESTTEKFKCQHKFRYRTVSSYSTSRYSIHTVHCNIAMFVVV